MQEEDELQITATEKISVRNNWLKIFVVVVATSVLALKLWEADFSKAFAAFDFSDLLALFLALFSIALSVLFYLKATDTSNVFYDNTYRFTKDVSEILGRVEAGFGEKLAHLDKGYSGLKSAVENIPFDRQQTQQDIEEEEQQLEKVERERAELIESLAERARLEGKEKDRLFQQIQRQDEELSNTRRELYLLRRRMMRAEMDANELPERMTNYLKTKVLSQVPSEIIAEAPLWVLNSHIKRVIESINNQQFSMDLKRFQVIDDDGDITSKGGMLIRNIIASKDA